MRYTKSLSLAGALATLFLLAPAARASLIFNLTYDDCTGGCGTGSTVFGQVHLVQLDTDDVSVTLTLTSGQNEGFISTGGPHQSLQFNIAGDPTIVISNLTTGFAIGNEASGSLSDAGGALGKFDYYIDCTGCGNGASSPLPGPLSFDVFLSTGLSVNDFSVNGNGFYFASDIIGPTTNTGNVAGNTVPVDPPDPTPEPSGLVLLPAALAGLWYARRRQQHC